MRLKTFIILCLITVFIPFLLGIMHPWAAFWWYAILFFSALPFVILLIIFFGCLIVSLFTKKNRQTAAIRLISTPVLFEIAFLSLSTSAFNGMYLHYKMVDGYEEIRQWTKGVELEAGDYTDISEKETPPFVRSFNPMYCSVYEIDGSRVTSLSWGSGILGISYSLLITEPGIDEKVVKDHKGSSKFRKIESGVYLTYSTH